MPSADWTPVVPGHTNDLRQLAEPADVASTQAGVAADAAADQVISLHVENPADGVLTVRVGGEVDTLTVPNLRSFLADQFQTAPRMLVLDLRDVGFLGSSGLAALVEARSEARRLGVTLRLVSAGHAVLRPLAATGLADQFDTYPDLDTALG